MFGVLQYYQVTNDLFFVTFYRSITVLPFPRAEGREAGICFQENFISMSCVAFYFVNFLAQKTKIRNQWWQTKMKSMPNVKCLFSLAFSISALNISSATLFQWAKKKVFVNVANFGDSLVKCLHSWPKCQRKKSKLTSTKS